MRKTYLFNYENGTPKSLYYSLSFMTGLLQDSYKFPIISYKSPIKRLQDSYKFPIISYEYLIKRSQDPYQEITGLI